MEAVQEVMERVDEYHKRGYGKANGDPHSYTTGMIPSHNVVLVHLAGMGANSAGSAAASVKFSFVNIKLALITDICGGVPNPQGRTRIHLGDLVISTAVVQYDFGRQYERGFKRKTGLEDVYGRPNEETRSFINKLNTRRQHHKLLSDLHATLQQLEQQHSGYSRPQTVTDVLVDASYLHKHHSMTE